MRSVIMENVRDERHVNTMQRIEVASYNGILLGKAVSGNGKP